MGGTFEFPGVGDAEAENAEEEEEEEEGAECEEEDAPLDTLLTATSAGGKANCAVGWKGVL